MIKRCDIIQFARSFAGCPFKHQGRIRAGIDCVGLIMAVATRFNVKFEDVPGYGRDPDGTMEKELAKWLEPVSIGNSLPGDVLSFWVTRPDLPCHVGIVTEKGLIHTYANVGRVVEHGLTTAWIRHTSKAWRYPGVEIGFDPATVTNYEPLRTPPPEPRNAGCQGCDSTDAAKVRASVKAQEQLLRDG